MLPSILGLYRASTEAQGEEEDEEVEEEEEEGDATTSQYIAGLSSNSLHITRT